MPRVAPNSSTGVLEVFVTLVVDVSSSSRASLRQLLDALTAFVDALVAGPTRRVSRSESLSSLVRHPWSGRRTH